jgi:hypothetical protein
MRHGRDMLARLDETLSRPRSPAPSASPPLRKRRIVREAPNRALPVGGLSWKIALWTLDRAMRSGEAIMASVCADGAEGLGRSSEGMAGLVLSRGHAGPPRLPPNKFRSRATSRRAQGSAWMLSPLSTHRTVCRCPSS